MKTTKLKSKLEQLKEIFPDAKEYNLKNQGFVSVDAARIAVYGKDVPAKLIFEKSIPTVNGVIQHYIFSHKAYKQEEVSLKPHKIFHRVKSNFLSDEPDQEMKYVGTVLAGSLDDAYFRSQNIDRNWNEENPSRSTSIGDAIEVDNEMFVVKEMGFEKKIIVEGLITNN